MIQRAVTAIIGVVIGLLATFSVFESILVGLDDMYLQTRGACNVGIDSRPVRALRLGMVEPETTVDFPSSFDDIDWSDNSAHPSSSGTIHRVWILLYGSR